jgi:hypothetical protein
MRALPSVIYTSSKADEDFQKTLKEDIDAAATGSGDAVQVHRHRYDTTAAACLHHTLG